MIPTTEQRTRKRSPRGGRRLRKLMAWSAHAYTALGLVAAAGIAVLLTQPEVNADSFRWAFVLMLTATLIDATDGTLARRVRVKEVLPGFDGRRLDDLIDFLTYTCLPLLLLWRAGDQVLPAGSGWCLLLPLLASAYGFCQVSAKTDDGFFLGFPSYWNLVAFYLYVLQPPPWLSLAILVVLALLTFVPSRYLYPTQRGRLNAVTNFLGAIWTALLVWILLSLPAADTAHDLHVQRLTLISLFFPIYYFAASWFISLKWWRSRRSRAREEICNALP